MTEPGPRKLSVWLVAGSGQAGAASFASPEDFAATYLVPHMDGPRAEIGTPRYPVPTLGELQERIEYYAESSHYPVPLTSIHPHHYWPSFGEYRLPILKRDGRGNPSLHLFPAHRHPHPL